jgi:uncharacterized membrane protein
MFLLISGLAIWSVTHLFPVLASAQRTRITAAIGTNAYRGVFAIVVLAAVTLMVFGWRRADPVQLFDPPAWGVTANYFLMVASVILFAASFTKNNLRRAIRHPQLSAVIVWATGHLLATGAERSVILFGAMAVWALVAIGGLNRRDGAWERPPPVAAFRDFVLLIVGAAAFFALVFAHPQLLDLSVLVGWVIP